MTHQLRDDLKCWSRPKIYYCFSIGLNHPNQYLSMCSETVFII
ncbi:hypothetical protein NP493_4132g00001 [Ridgeia piscesae]|uniref:Uncharacterized protein n=1 Tax=Ridgeia piscesae TaxID=27915 RepID=A0AAD9J0H3_RIDPI|nr:hypothetical protein NP493_4132g00001 [Ridgeia piscesae]